MIKLIDVFEVSWKRKGDLQLHWNAEVNMAAVGYHTITKTSDKAIVAQLFLRRGETRIIMSTELERPVINFYSMCWYKYSICWLDLR